MSQVVQSITIGDATVLVSAAAAIVVYLMRLYNRRQSLRTAFLAELNEPEDVLENIAETPVVPDEDFIPTQIYESMSDDLGLLSQAEVQKLVEYYSIAFQLKNWLNDPHYTVTIPQWYYEELQEELEEDDFQMEDFAERVHSSDDVDPAVERARNLNEIRKEAIEQIECRLH